MRASARSLFPFLFVCASATLGKDKSENAATASAAAGLTYIRHVTVIDTETGNEAEDHTVIIARPNFGSNRQAKA
jgi:hypothetical protein